MEIVSVDKTDLVNFGVKSFNEVHSGESATDYN